MNKKSKNKNSLASQFFVIISGIIFLAMSVNGYLQYISESKNISKSLHAHGKSLSELLAAISVEPLLIYDDVTLNDYAQFTSRQKDIVFAAVVNTDKISLTHYLNRDNGYLLGIPDVGEIVDILPVLNSLRVNPNILFVETPVRFKDEIIAYSWVGLDKVPYEKESLRTLLNIVFVTICVAVSVAGTIFFMFRYKIFQPIKLLIKSTQNIAKFEFENPVVIEGKGEISTLAESFDQMRRQLRDVIESRKIVMDKLSDFNDSLEDRVRERTEELQMLNLKISHQAMHDPLTNLPNRLLIIEQLHKEISYAVRNKSTLSFFMIDLNNFKDVNDTLGHPMGDRLLKDVAQRLKNTLRESDTVGRLGGDEFAVVLPNVSIKQTRLVAEKILENLEPNFNLDSHSMKIGASVGISMYPQHGKDHTSLIRTADVAMYEAKKSNSNICVYNPELDKYTKLRLALMSDLHDALNENQLVLHYQPKVSLKEGRVLSVEALIRWNHPQNGLIFPDEFIPLAETSDLINDLSYWVLEHAFAQWESWKKQGKELQIAVNLSSSNLIDPNLPEQISKLNKQYNMQDNGIKIEITESTIMSNIDVAMKIMADEYMQKLQFSIDDFGTGYSSLSYLKKLAVSEVKIDRTFVGDMATDEDDESIVKSVIDLAHNLGHTVVAEGVETREVLDRLILMGCDDVQGYYFSKPVTSDKLLSVIDIIERDFAS